MSGSDQAHIRLQPILGTHFETSLNANVAEPIPVHMGEKQSLQLMLKRVMAKFGWRHCNVRSLKELVLQPIVVELLELLEGH